MFYILDFLLLLIHSMTGWTGLADFDDDFWYVRVLKWLHNELFVWKGDTLCMKMLSYSFNSIVVGISQSVIWNINLYACYYWKQWTIHNGLIDAINSYVYTSYCLTKIYFIKTTIKNPFAKILLQAIYQASVTCILYCTFYILIIIIQRKATVKIEKSICLPILM